MRDSSRVRRFALLVLLAAFATVLALIALDPRPAGAPDPAPFTPATAGPPVIYQPEEP